jgi:GT2 family glycosyltransferase
MSDVSPRVTVGIPSWNGRRFLEVVLPSLAVQTFRDFETVVVDNGSSDGSIDYLRTRWPHVKVIALDANHGFAEPVNRVIKCAQGDYIALVNNDVELSPGFLAALVETLDTHPQAAAASAKMVAFHDRSVIDGAGDELYWSGTALRRGRGERDNGRWDTPGEVFSACAGAALYRRAAFEAVGYFDKDFFAYQEDVDWGFRARLAGWGCRYEPRAIAYHVGSATTSRDGKPHPLVHRLNQRNALAMVIKNYPAETLVRYGHRVALAQVASLAGSIRLGMARHHLAGLADLARSLPTTLRKRAAIQRSRRIGRRDLARAVSPGRDPCFKAAATAIRGH